MDSLLAPTHTPVHTPAAPSTLRRPWVAPALVGTALVGWLATLWIVWRLPLHTLPRYYLARYLVLDATSLLFMLVVTTVFLGICVYLYSRERDTPALQPDIRSRAALMLGFTATTNIGLMANHLVLHSMVAVFQRWNCPCAPRQV